MRTASSVVLVIVALLLAAVSGPAIWTEQNVVSEDGFVKLAGPLGTNTEFQQGLTAVVATQSAAQLDIPPLLQNVAAGLITTTAKSLYSMPGYGAAWEETLRRSHALTLAPSTDQKAQGTLNLDIEPLVGLVADQISTTLNVEMPIPAQILVSMDQPAVAKAMPLVTAVAGLGSWFAFFAVVLFILSIILARNRPRTVIAAGVGLALVALGWWLGSGWVVGQFADLGSSEGVAAQFGKELGALAKTSWQGGITFGFILAGGLVVAGVVYRLVRRNPAV